jgi:hypothetical protein
MDVALAVFSFRRPDKLRQVLTALPGCGVSKIYHFCDGPRSDADNAICEDNQKVALSVDTKIPTEFHIRERNIGITENLISGIDYVLTHHDAIIVLEDDIIPNSYFFEFIRTSLISYKDRRDIFSISGYNPLPNNDIPNMSTFLSPRFFCWGWATWTDRWNSISARIRNGDSPFAHYWMVPDTAGNDLRWNVRSWRLRKKTLVWDQRVALNTLATTMFHVCPPVNLISNIGFDGSGEHCPTGISVTACDSKSAQRRINISAAIAPEAILFEKIAMKHSQTSISITKRIFRRVTYWLRMGQ